MRQLLAVLSQRVSPSLSFRGKCLPVRCNTVASPCMFHKVIDLWNVAGRNGRVILLQKLLPNTFIIMISEESNLKHFVRSRSWCNRFHLMKVQIYIVWKSWNWRKTSEVTCTIRNAFLMKIAQIMKTATRCLSWPLFRQSLWPRKKLELFQPCFKEIPT